MRRLLLAGAALVLAAPLGAQQTADQANAQAQPAPTTATVITTPAVPAETTVLRTPAVPAVPARTTVITTPAVPAQTTVVVNNPGNLTPPPVAALNKTYPVCTRVLQDSCQNPGEGGAPGRSRALSYWPGEPASERTDRGG